MQYDIITIGGSTEDIMYYTNEAVLIKNKGDILRQELLGFEFGAKIVADKVLFTFGGGGANTAVNLAGMGLKTGIITSVGEDDTGARITQNFKDNKVSTAFIQKYKNAPSGLAFVVNFTGATEHVIFKFWSANDQLEIKESLLKKAATRWFYLTSLPKRKWRENLNNIFNTASQKNIKIAWNPGSNQLTKGYKALRKYLKQTEVLILNKDEAIELVLSSGKKIQKVPQLLKYLKEMGPEIVSITEGARGASVCSSSYVCFQKAPKARGVNTTGAGDAFGSTLVGGLILNKDLKTALHLAIIQSNHVIRKIGAQKGLLSLRKLKKMMTH